MGRGGKRLRSSVGHCWENLEPLLLFCLVTHLWWGHVSQPVFYLAWSLHQQQAAALHSFIPDSSTHCRHIFSSDCYGNWDLHGGPDLKAVNLHGQNAVPVPHFMSHSPLLLLKLGVDSRIFFSWILNGGRYQCVHCAFVLFSPGESQLTPVTDPLVPTNYFSAPFYSQKVSLLGI